MKEGEAKSQKQSVQKKKLQEKVGSLEALLEQSNTAKESMKTEVQSLNRELEALKKQVSQNSKAFEEIQHEREILNKKVYPFSLILYYFITIT